MIICLHTVIWLQVLFNTHDFKVRSPDGDTDYFDIVAGVLQGDTLAPYLFIICLEHMLRMSTDLMKENGFKLAKERSRRYPTQTITDVDYADDIDLHVNADKTEYICFNQRGDIFTLKNGPLKLVDKFTYLGSSISSTENDINTQLAKAWIVIDKLSVMWKSDLIDKIKCSFFHAVVISMLLYGCTIWTLTKHMEKKLDSNYTIMLRAVLNKSWRQHPTKQQLYGYLTLITKTIQVRRTRHVGHCWRSKDELISYVLL